MSVRRGSVARTRRREAAKLRSLPGYKPVQRWNNDTRTWEVKR